MPTVQTCKTMSLEVVVPAALRVPKHNYYFCVPLIIIYVVVLLLTQQLRQVSATIYVPSQSITFRSYCPAYDNNHKLLLSSTSSSSSSSTERVKVQLQHITGVDGQICTLDNTSSIGKKIYPPQHDNLPIALLLQKAICSLERVEYNAERLSDLGVKYIILYGYDIDEEKEQNENQEGSSKDHRAAVLVISKQTGSELIQLLHHSSDRTLEVSLNETVIPISPQYQQPQQHHHHAKSPSDLPDYVYMNTDSKDEESNNGDTFVSQTIRTVYIIMSCCSCLFIICVNSNGSCFMTRRVMKTRPSGRLTPEQIDTVLTRFEYNCTTDDKTTTRTKTSVTDHHHDDNDDTTTATQQQPFCQECTVCLEEFQQSEEVYALPCNHLFHHECIIPWLSKRHCACPICKFNITDHYHNTIVANDNTDSNNNGSGNEQEDCETFHFPVPPPGLLFPRGLWISHWALLNNSTTANNNNNYHRQPSLLLPPGHQVEPSFNDEESVLQSQNNNDYDAAGIEMTLSLT